ncbi:hypothetical protein BH24ACT26_BH24ACT26_19870 [soil metagenome]
MSDYGYSVEVAEGYDEAVIRTRLALRAEGFSVVTEMHVGGLLGPEAGDERQYLFMGAWAPPASTREIDADLQVAVHLPCNFVVQESGSGAIVAALDPAEDLDGPPAVQQSARDALGRVLERVRVAQ